MGTGDACGLPGFQGGGLVYDGVGGFHQRYGLGYGDKERRCCWGYAGHMQVGWWWSYPGIRALME